MAVRWSPAVLNPYQPPQCSEPVAEVIGPAVMQVRYSQSYSLMFAVLGVLAVTLGIVLYPLSWLVTGMMGVSGIAHLALAVLSRRRVYFEVFEDRLEFLSPVFPRWRRAKPLETIGARSLYRWAAKREDFKRFVARREGFAG